MSAPLDEFAQAGIRCRELIARQLEVREELEELKARDPGHPRVQVLGAKVDKLRAETETAFLLAMDALSRRS